MKRIALSTFCALGTLAALASHAQAAALTTGDIAFTSFNADEDGLSFVTFVDIDPGTVVYFSDNEWDGTAMNSGESITAWNSGATAIAAGTVVRFSAFDAASRAASAGSLTVVDGSNYGISASGEVVYAYLGSSGTTPTTFLTAIANDPFNASNGLLTNTGLTEGVNAIRLDALVTSASPDYAEYTGARSGQASFAGYKGLVNNVANWNVDTTNGSYATTVPDTTAFTTVPVPEGDGLVLAMSGLLGLAAMARRNRR